MLINGLKVGDLVWDKKWDVGKVTKIIKQDKQFYVNFASPRFTLVYNGDGTNAGGNGEVTLEK